MRLKSFLLLVLSLLVLNCGGDDAKSAETRILAEINRITETSRMRMHTPEIKASMKRMNEVRPLFPQNREEIETEAKAIRDLFSDLIDDNKKTNRKWEELVALPLAVDYRKCVEVQIRSLSASTARLQLVIEEMDLFLDRTIIDAESLETSLKPLRVRQEGAESQSQQVDAEVAANCRRPS